MGCGGSKDDTKGKKGEQANAADINTNANANAHAGESNSNVASSAAAPQAAAGNAGNATPRVAETPAGRATNPNENNIVNQDRASSTAAPSNGPRRTAESAAAAAKEDVDEHGNPVVLPKGDWVKTEGTPYYYSATENLYYHPPSWQFYDPTNEMWYDPEKNEWYHDDGDDDEAAAVS